MKEIGKNQEIDNLVEEEIRNVFGYGNEKLIADFDAAVRQMGESDCTPPKGEFERIVARVDEIEVEEKKSPKKVARLRRVGKIGLLVTILGYVLMGVGIGASGKRAYEYEPRTPSQGKSYVWNSTENLEPIYEVEEAYQKARDELGVDVLRSVYIPEKMELSNLILGDGYIQTDFTRDENYIYFIQSQYPVENSGNTVMDCEKVKTVYSKALKLNLLIKKNSISGNRVEYFIEFTIDKTYYYPVGVISEEEFEDILIKINH